MKKKLFLSSIAFVLMLCFFASNGYGMKRKREESSDSYEPSRKRRKKPGKVMVILNGVMSSGKTTIGKGVNQFGEYDGSRFDWLDRDDHVAGHFVPDILDFWKKYCPNDARPIRLDSYVNKEKVRLHPKDYQDIRNFVNRYHYELANVSYKKKIIEGFLDRVIKQYDENETCLIVEAGLGSKIEFKHWMKKLAQIIAEKGWKVYLVKVDCSPDEKVSLKEIWDRTASRMDRDFNNISRQIPSMHTYFPCQGSQKRKKYDFTLYTKDRSQKELVRELLINLQKTKPRAIWKNFQMIQNDEAQEKIQNMLSNDLHGLDSLLHAFEAIRQSTPSGSPERDDFDEVIELNEINIIEPVRA